jgi:hypothetical protein
MVVKPKLGNQQITKEKTLCKSLTHRGFPVDCLGLTKRWSLYVASHGNSRVGNEKPEGQGPRDETSRDQRGALIRTHRLVCGL